MIAFLYKWCYHPLSIILLITNMLLECCWSHLYNIILWFMSQCLSERESVNSPHTGWFFMSCCYRGYTTLCKLLIIADH